MKDTTSITTDVMIGTNLFPLKKARNLGSSKLWNLLYNSPAITPQRIPTNWLLIFPNAGETSLGATPVIWATAPAESKVVTTSKATSPARAAAPFLSLESPKATPTANNIGMLSMIAAPALIKNAASWLFPPQPVGSIQYPIPIKIAAAGRTATGTIKALPIFCK